MPRACLSTGGNLHPRRRRARIIDEPALTNIMRELRQGGFLGPIYGLPPVGGVDSPPVLCWATWNGTQLNRRLPVQPPRTAFQPVSRSGNGMQPPSPVTGTETPRCSPSPNSWHGVVLLDCIMNPFARALRVSMSNRGAGSPLNTPARTGSGTPSSDPCCDPSFDPFGRSVVWTGLQWLPPRRLPPATRRFAGMVPCDYSKTEAGGQCSHTAKGPRR
jgi:hypothetical protein